MCFYDMLHNYNGPLDMAHVHLIVLVPSEQYESVAMMLPPSVTHITCTFGCRNTLFVPSKQCKYALMILPHVYWAIRSDACAYFRRETRYGRKWFGGPVKIGPLRLPAQLVRATSYWIRLSSANVPLCYR